MNTVLLFFIKVFLCSGALYGYYWLLLRNKRFHRYNRYYLLGSLVFSFVLPLLKVPILYTPANKINGFVYQTIEVISVGHWEDEGMILTAKSGHAGIFNAVNDLYMLYFAGVMIGTWFLLRSLLYIHFLRAAWPYERVQRLRIYSTRERGTPFSFFRSVFWNEDIPFNSPQGQQVFRHELYHVQQKHSHDILLAEIITVAGWFNPFFHLIKKELKAIHEFLADEHATAGKDSYAYAELLLQQVIAARRSPVTHYFFQNHIKRRIAMITQHAHQHRGFMSRVMVLPVAALLFCTFTLYAQRGSGTLYRSASLLTGAADSITVVVDAGHGGTDPGAQNQENGMQEKDIALQLARKMEELAPAYHVKVLLTRSDDRLPGNGSIQEGLHYRTTFTENAKADVFVSLHMGAAENLQHGGMEVFITASNQQFMSASKQLGAAVIGSLNKVYTTSSSLMQSNQRNIWVLDHAACPAILIECGYITNAADAQFISSAQHQEQVVKRILEGIIASKSK